LTTESVGLGVDHGLLGGGSGCLGELTLFAQGENGGAGGRLSAAGCFNAIGGGFECGGLRCSQCGESRLLRLIGSGGEGAGFGLLRFLLGGLRRGFGFGLCFEFAVEKRFGGAVANLGTVLAAGGGVVAVFGSAEIGPGVEAGYIVRRAAGSCLRIDRRAL